MTHQEIVDKVKSILNEHGEVDALSIGDDRVQLEKYINVAIPDAVIMLASKGYRVNVEAATSKGGGGALTIDFISLVYAKDTTWKRAITKVTEVGSAEYNIAMNPYTAPGVNNPMCYVDPQNNGNALLFLPGMESTGIVQYNKKYDGKNLNAEPKEATAVCYMAAALVLGMFGDDQGKQRLSDISTNLLN